MKIEIIFFFAAILIVGAFLLIIIEISKKQTKKIDIEKYRVKWLEIQNQINPIPTMSKSSKSNVSS